MKSIKIYALAAATLLVTSCGLGTTGTTSTSSATGTAGSILGSVLSSATNPETIGNVLQSVLGLDKVTKQSIIGTWKYNQPGCAFTSENLLAQAGGEAVATSIKQKLGTYFQTAGISSANTQVTLKEDGTFTAQIAGRQWSGTWTFTESNYKLQLKGLLLNVNCYVKKNTNGIGLLFEASKLLTVMQTLSALSGNQTAQTIGDLSKNYNGLRVGFDMKK